MGFFNISCCRPHLYNIFICRTAVLEIRNVALLNGCALKICMLSHVLFLSHLLPAPFKDALSPDSVGNPFPPISLQSGWCEAIARGSGGACAGGTESC